MKNKQGIRVSINSARLKRRNSNPNLANFYVFVAIGAANLGIVENSDSKNRRRIMNLPSVLLVVFGVQAVDYGPSADPFVAVLRDAVRVRRASTVPRLHRMKPVGIQDSELENTNGFLP
ncbi:hypothetical protein TorRG33x02_121230 [Trema orientale]|uniref:Uncharacterized protein n=1 Tax=Trema orientale TaxID=63057 RepID=A0A2P5F2N0_TREOI|nr:hypothetical protein TorRG33x02_121230 [Trema orientale]